MAEPARPDVRYTAFLSYSHKDSAAAGRLHRRLEAYRMPKRLVGSEGTRGPVPDRLSPIFRDREELPAATDLSETVRAALAQAGALIILCSDHAAGSLWVAEEIETFRTLHPDRPILAAILAGEPPDCFPAALRAFGRDGTWHEPLATDLRPGKDGKQLGLLKLVAGITGVGLDALVQRDAARRVRRITALSMLVLIALLIMTSLAVIALNARREAELQRAEAEGQIEFMLTDLRQRLRGVGRLDIMTAVNRQALTRYDRQRELGESHPDSLLREARIFHAIGEDELTLSRPDAARDAFQRAYGITSSLIARGPNDPERIFVHAQSEYWIGDFAFARHNYRAARRRFERYRDLAGRLLAIDSTNLTWIREAGYAESNLCSLGLRERADAQHTFSLCTAALMRMEQIRSKAGLTPEVTLDLANRHAWLADALAWQGRWREVLEHRKQQENLARRLITHDQANLDYQDFWMRTQFTYGRLLLEHGNGDEAQPHLREAAETAARLRQRDPANASWRSFEREILDAMN